MVAYVDTVLRVKQQSTGYASWVKTVDDKDRYYESRTAI